MKLALRAAVALLPLALHCESAHAFDLEADKRKHLGVSFLLGVGAEQFAARALPQYNSVAVGTAIAFAPGLLKELVDHRRKGRSGRGEGFSHGDLAADAVGAFAGALVSKYVSDRLTIVFGRDAAGARRFGVSYTVPLN